VAAYDPGAEFERVELAAFLALVQEIPAAVAH